MTATGWSWAQIKSQEYDRHRKLCEKSPELKPRIWKDAAGNWLCGAGYHTYWGTTPEHAFKSWHKGIYG